MQKHRSIGKNKQGLRQRSQGSATSPNQASKHKLERRNSPRPDEGDSEDDSRSGDDSSDTDSVPLLVRSQEQRSIQPAASPRRRSNSPQLARGQNPDQASDAAHNRSDQSTERADPDRVIALASTVNQRAGDVINEAARLSEGQIQIVEAMRGQLLALSDLQRQVEEIERQIEATLPPVIPLDTLIAFQPPFKQLPVQNEAEPMRLRGSYNERDNGRAARNLDERLQQGLLPASKVDRGQQAVSGDDKVAHVVSVNVFPPTRGDPARSAQFGATYRAGGAIPIAIEQFGDSGRIDREALEQRARDSAILIIDPAALPAGDQSSVQRQSEGGGGELGLDQVPAVAIVAVLAPASMGLQPLSKPTQYVGAVESEVYYAGARQTVTIQHPDYESALRALFAANPNKTLITHTTRLGPPRPIGE